MIDVHILVTCTTYENEPLAGLVFDTIRTGFPVASVSVTLNNWRRMPTGAADRLQAKAEAVCCGVTRWERELEHGSWIRDTLESARYDLGHVRPQVFVDTDVIFWADCSDIPARILESERMFGGRWIPSLSPFGERSWSPGRIHPSFFVVPRPRWLIDEIARLKKLYWYLRPFEGYTYVDPLGTMCVYDTLSSLSSILADEAYHFDENELDRYDHLFGATYPETFERTGMDPSIAAALRQTHEVAKRDPKLLKGLWRKQNISRA